MPPPAFRSNVLGCTHAHHAAAVVRARSQHQSSMVAPCGAGVAPTHDKRRNVLQKVATCYRRLQRVARGCNVLQHERGAARARDAAVGVARGGRARAVRADRPGVSAWFDLRPRCSDAFHPRGRSACRWWWPAPAVARRRERLRRSWRDAVRLFGVCSAAHETPSADSDPAKATRCAYNM